MSTLPHFCPNCGYEYESWIEICPDCGVLVKPVDAKVETPIDESKGEMKSDEDPKWTVVGNVPNAIIGSLIKSQLEDAGIPALMMRAPSADIAQFSGNDYVPHVILVPQHRKDEARSLMDSRPNFGFGDMPWGAEDTFDEADEDWDDDDAPAADVTDLRRLWNADTATANVPAQELPDGWTMLPTESSAPSLTEQQAAHQTAQPQSAPWYWQSSDAPAVAPGESVPSAEGAPSPYRRRKAYSTRSSSDGEDLSEYNRDDAQWTGPSKWIRVFYGILLLALSLPFIFQLLTQLTSIFK